MAIQRVVENGKTEAQEDYSVSSSNEDEEKMWLTKLEDPINFTDPIVIFDPEMKKPTVVKPLLSDATNPDSPEDSTKVDGIYVPIIQINSTVISFDKIKSFKIRFVEFTPTLELVINDNKREIQYLGGPGLNNRINVILTGPVDKLYKKISLAFYITERVNLTTDEIKYVGKYYHNGLMCVSCEQIGDDQLTTYEFCEKIAKMLQLGFAATENCKEVSDKRWRQIYSQKIDEFIENQISISGVDEDSCLDAWIDLNGYLVLVNVSWVFNQDVKMENLSLDVVGGYEGTDKNIPDPKPQTIKRIVTNWESIPNKSIRIKRSFDYLNTEKTQDSTLKNCWILQNAGDTNSLELLQVQIIEDSIDGKKGSNLYEFHKSEFLGCEMSEDSPYLYQQQVRKMFFNKKYSKQLCLEMEGINYGYERGTLVSVLFSEDDPMKIRNINKFGKDNVNATNVDDSEEAPKDMEDLANKELKIPITNEQPPSNAETFNEENITINPSLSGIYYILGFEYVYDPDIQKMRQHLYLIKKDNSTPLVHQYGVPKITEEENSDEV